MHTRVCVFPINCDYFKAQRNTMYSSDKNTLIFRNNELYQENKLFIDNWLDKYYNLLNVKSTYKKLEVPKNFKNDIFDYYIQLRPSGIRIKYTDKFPSLVAMVQIPIYGKEKRYLTPTECMRLQSFPTDFDFNGESDNIIYKQLGNSVNVDVIYVVYKSIINSLNL